MPVGLTATTRSVKGIIEMKFRKRPVEVEAMQFTEETKDRIFEWTRQGHGGVYATFKDGLPTLTIETLEGTMVVNFGDWVIKGVEGEIYPCKPSIFEKTYEPVKGAADG